MKLKDLIDITDQDLCIMDGIDESSLILRIRTYGVNKRFWLTENALELEIFQLFLNEKYPGCLCVILGDIDD